MWKESHPPRGFISQSEGADTARVDAFGKSLAEFVDRQNPANSLLSSEAHPRTQHTGGERIPKGSAEEAALKSWIGYLANLSGPELAEALRYRQAEAGGYGVAPKVVLRRLTHSQYNNTVRDLLKEGGNPANQFPPEDYVNGLQEPIRGAVRIADFGRRLQPIGGKARRERVPSEAIREV